MSRAWFFNLLAAISALIAASLLGAAPVAAQAGTVGEPIRTCVLRAAPGMKAAQLLQTPSRFDCRTRQNEYGPGSFWLISQNLSADGSGQRLAVRSVSVWQTRMTLYAVYADGAIIAISTDAHAATRNIQLGAIISRWLPRRSASLTRLLWHIEGSSNLRGIIVSPTLATASQTATSNIVMAGIYAAFGGMCLALLLYNLGLARALRHAFLPYYCAMMIGLLLYAFSSSGALALALPGIENSLRLRMNYLTLALTGVAALGFLRHFFEERVITPRLGRMIPIASAAVVLPAIGVALFAPWHLRAFDAAFSGGFVVLIATIVPIMINAWRQRSEFLWLFVIAWSAPILLAVARTAYSFQLLAYSFWLDNSTILSMVFEALLSSLAIAYRILLITRERDEAREQEIAARLLADTDPLTGLLNRRAFLARAIGREGPQHLLLIDIDNFKRVNDTIGHDGGDEVLRVVARILRATTHPHALIARIGGEEFAIVADADRPIEAESVLAGFRAGRMPFDLAVTASIGTCAGPLMREADWKSLYCRADRALFDAKAAGRDRVRAAQGVSLSAAA